MEWNGMEWRNGPQWISIECKSIWCWLRVLWEREYGNYMFHIMNANWHLVCKMCVWYALQLIHITVMVEMFSIFSNFIRKISEQFRRQKLYNFSKLHKCAKRNDIKKVNRYKIFKMYKSFIRESIMINGNMSANRCVKFPK